MSVQQQQLWLAQAASPDSAAYVVTNGYELDGKLDVDALHSALLAIARRHPALRTTFHAEKGRLYTMIRSEPDGLEFTVVDLVSVTAADRDATSQRVATDMMTEPFQLDRQLPMRCRLLLLAPRRSVLLLAWHHLVIDDWSVRHLEADLAEHYAALTAGRTVTGAGQSATYHDFARWQERELADLLIRDGTPEFWRRYLAGAPECVAIPTDLPRPPVPTGRGESVRFTVPPPLARRLGDRARAARTTVNIVTLAAFKLALREWTGLDDLVIGLPFAARGVNGMASVVGLFVNLIPVRTKLDGSTGFDDALRRVRSSALAAFDHHMTPFGWLVATVRPRRTRAHPPLVQVIFQLVEDPPGVTRPSQWGQLRVREWDSLDDHSSTFDLDLVLRPDPTSGLHGVLTYRSDLFIPRTIDSLVDLFLRRLDAADAAAP